jgi:UDP-N-acetylglucosamine--N-acetylmuramyl-(pentapeptide) pyrophosphoryl-undecaprenol N-acetylglucosamine transferase
MSAASDATVLICAGGTGGHVFPGLAVAGELRRRGVRVVWLGTPTGMEVRLVGDAGIEFHAVGVRGLRGKGALGLPVTLVRALRAVWGSLRLLRRIRPDVVLGMGGYVSGPCGLAAWLSRRPLVLHEQNAVPGLTNRLLRPLARLVLEAFPGSFGNRGARHVGNPVRESICAQPDPAARDRARTSLRVLVLGGSQGALALNTSVPGALSALSRDVPLEVCHQAGARSLEVARDAYRKAGLAVVPEAFIDDIGERYAWADVVICRAGAMTVSELAAVGVAAILVPFPFAVDDHQSANARYLSDGGAAVLMPQDRLSSESLCALLRELWSSAGRLREMAERARALARPDASRAVADACLEVAGA